MSCNPAAVIKLYPVVAVSVVIHTLTICVDFPASAQVVKLFIAGTRAAADIRACVIFYDSDSSAGYIFKSFIAQFFASITNPVGFIVSHIPLT